MAAFATWNILQATNVTDENLVQLQRDWEALEITSPLKDSFLFERVNELRMFDSFRQSPTNAPWWLSTILIQKGYNYEQIGKGDSARWGFVDKSPALKKLLNRISIPWDEAQWRWFWSFEDEIRAQPIWEVVLEGTSQLATNHAFLFTQAFVKTNFARLNTDSLTNDPFETESQNAVSQLYAIHKAAMAEVIRDVVITAIALKRHELRHQQIPDSLTELVPDFLNAVPTDYMNGQPLHYRRNADGTFLLYSVGENGKDDGGDPSLEKGITGSNFFWQYLHALDWVWPQPATEADIQNYYAHLPK
jgi:hypothetical protein